MEEEDTTERIKRFREIFESLEDEETIIKPFLCLYEDSMSKSSGDEGVFLDYLVLGGARQLMIDPVSCDMCRSRDYLEAVLSCDMSVYRDWFDLALRKFGIRDPEFRERNIDDKRLAVSIIRDIIAARDEIDEEWYRDLRESGWLDE